MRICLWLLLQLISLSGMAVSGSWSADVAGVTLQQSGVSDRSPLLRAASILANNTRITRVSWRYQLLSPAPAGLQVQLCTSGSCVALETGSGQSDAFQGMAADSEFYFIYYVQSRGVLNPPLRALNNQLIVNYQ